MTRGAREFIGPITFEAVTGRPVHTEIFGPGHALDHIRLAREANVIVVAPATADFVGRAAHGLADDLLTACLLAATSKVLLVPAMNDRMWSHAQTKRNVEHARSLGYEILEPAEGPLAIGEGSGPGRMPEPDEIMSRVGRLLESKSSLKGKKVIVTAGATREPIDPVRFISNHSSGKMGVALARAAWRRGADVTLIAGHVDIPLPSEILTLKTDTVKEMARAVAEKLLAADVLIMAAAPADFRPASVAPEKIKKGKAAPKIVLEPTEDILKSTISRRKKSKRHRWIRARDDRRNSERQGKAQVQGARLRRAERRKGAGRGFWRRYQSRYRDNARRKRRGARPNVEDRPRRDSSRSRRKGAEWTLEFCSVATSSNAASWANPSSFSTG